MISDLHRLGTSHVQSQGPSRRVSSRLPNPSSAPTSSATRARSRTKLTADVNPDNSPHVTISKLKVKRHPSPIPSCVRTPPKQKPVRRRGVGGSTTASVGGTEYANDDPRFLEAVSIGESLEHGLEAFLPLLESVPPMFRSRRYHRRKNEFLNVKGVLSATVRTLKARQRGDIRNIAQQYLSFKHMIYDNLRSLLLWLDSEMEAHKETQQQKEMDELPAQTSSNVQGLPSPQPQPQQQPVCQPTEIVDSPIIGQLSGPSKRSDKRRSVFSEVASSLTQILNSPLDVEMSYPVGDATNFLILGGVLKYASLQALIAILTNSNPNPNITHLDQLHDTFLLCFRCFSTSADVVNALTARYRQPQPRNLTEEQENAWPFHLQAIRLRVIDVLRAWVDSYWVHEDDRQAAPLIQHFLESTTELRWSEASKNIAQSLRRHLLIPNHPNMCHDTRHLQATNGAAKVRFAEHRKDSIGLLETYAVKALRGSSRENALNSANPVDDLVQNEDVAHVLVFDSNQHCMELARQLTLFMSIEFRRLDPEKLWHHSRRQCEDCETEQIVKMLQLHASALQVWTARTVLEQDDPETRAGILTWFVALAFRLRKLRNFSALCAVYSGLTSGFMEKLSQESLPLPESTKSALQDLCQLVQESRSDHELAIDCRNPTVPPIEWFLEDLRSVSSRQRRAPVPGMPKNALNIESYYEVPRIVRSMEKCHIPYASVVRASRVQAWVSKSLFEVSERDLREGRAWVEARCDAIERKGPPQPKLFAQCLPLPLIRKETSSVRTCTEITHLVPELLPSALNLS